MFKVKLTYPFDWPIIKQTPKRSGKWGDCIFYINEDITECDFWVVFEGLRKNEVTICPQENTLLITAEPPPIKTYNKSFVNQFSWILSCHDFKRKNVILAQQGLNWMVGGKYEKVEHSWSNEHSKDYDELILIHDFPKTKLMSIVASNKKITPGHKGRIKFIESAKEKFGDQLDVYGVGFKEISDKWDAINPYKYHIVLENSCIQHYWTEKLTDSYLAGAYPFYYGCPNIADYFSSDAISSIDIFEPEESLLKIEKLIQAQTYEKSNEAIMIARQLVLNKYNLFSLISDFCESRPVHSKSKSIKHSIHPENHFASQGLRSYVKKVTAMIRK